MILTKASWQACFKRRQIESPERRKFKKKMGKLKLKELMSCLKYNPQYKRLISNCYPRSDSRECPKGILFFFSTFFFLIFCFFLFFNCQGTVSKITMYAITNPDRLSIIGKRIQKLTTKSMRRRKFGHAEIGANLMDELASACHADIALFADYVLNIADMLISSTVAPLRLKIVAIEMV